MNIIKHIKKVILKLQKKLYLIITLKLEKLDQKLERVQKLQLRKLLQKRTQNLLLQLELLVELLLQQWQQVLLRRHLELKHQKHLLHRLILLLQMFHPLLVVLRQYYRKLLLQLERRLGLCRKWHMQNLVLIQMQKRKVHLLLDCFNLLKKHGTQCLEEKVKNMVFHQIRVHLMLELMH